MRSVLFLGVLVALIAGPAMAQGQRPATMSPYYNVLHNDTTIQRRVVTEQRITTRPGQSYAAWGSGFILGGTGGCHFHGPSCYWVSGHYEYYERTVWIPSHWEERYVPAVYHYQYVDGRQALVLVAAERFERHFVPSHYTRVPDSYWVPGHWTCGY